MEIINFFRERTKNSFSPSTSFDDWIKVISPRNSLASRLEAVAPYCHFLSGLDSQRTPTPTRQRDGTQATIANQEPLTHERLWQCWNAIEDLYSNQDRESQKAVYAIICVVSYYHFHLLGDLRGVFFRCVLKSTISDEIKIRTLNALTKNGTKILGFQSETWRILSACLERNFFNREFSLLLARFLVSADLLPEETYCLTTLDYCHRISLRTADAGKCEALLELCEAMIPVMTPNALTLLVCFLSKAVVLLTEKNLELCWRLTERLFTGPLKFQAVKKLCCVLEDKKYSERATMLSGAIDILSRAMWGKHRLPLLASPVSALASFAQALAGANATPVVASAMKAVLSLVQELSFMLLIEWDHILKMTEFSLEFVKIRSRQLIAVTSPATGAMVTAQQGLLSSSASHADKLELATVKSIRLWIFQILDAEETLLFAGKFSGDEKELLRLLIAQSWTRPIEKNIALIDYLKESDYISVFDDDCLPMLRLMMTSFFVNDQREAVREKVLIFLFEFFDQHHNFYGTEIVTKIILTFLPTIYMDSSAAIREQGIQVLLHVATRVELVVFYDVLEVLQNALKNECVVKESRHQVVNCVIELFTTLCGDAKAAPKQQCLAKMLIELLNDADSHVRRLVLGLLLQVRSDPKHLVYIGNLECKSLRISIAEPTPPVINLLSSNPMIVSNPNTNTSSSKTPQLGIFPMAKLLENLMLRLKQETLPELFIAIFRGLLHFPCNRWVLDNPVTLLAVLRLARELCRLLSAKHLGFCSQEGFMLSDRQNAENYDTVLQILFCVIPYLVQPPGRFPTLIPHGADGDLLTQIFVAFVDGFTVFTSNLELLDYHHRVIANLLHGISICLMYKSDEFSDKYLPYIIDTLDLLVKSSGYKVLYVVFYLNFLNSFVCDSMRRPAMEQATRKMIAILLRLLSFPSAATPKYVAVYVYQTLLYWFVTAPEPRRMLFYPVIMDELKRQMDRNEHVMLVESMVDYFAMFASRNARLDIVESDTDASSMVGSSVGYGLVPFRFSSGGGEFGSSSANELNKERRGETRQSWAYGNAVLSITTGEFGWVKISIRKAAGILTWFTKLQHSSSITSLMPSLTGQLEALHSHVRTNSNSSSANASASASSNTSGLPSTTASSAGLEIEREEAREHERHQHVQTLLSRLVAQREMVSLADVEISEEEKAEEPVVAVAIVNAEPLPFHPLVDPAILPLDSPRSQVLLSPRSRLDSLPQLKDSPRALQASGMPIIVASQNLSAPDSLPILIEKTSPMKIGQIAPSTTAESTVTSQAISINHAQLSTSVTAPITISGTTPILPAPIIASSVLQQVSSFNPKASETGPLFENQPTPIEAKSNPSKFLQPQPEFPERRLSAANEFTASKLTSPRNLAAVTASTFAIAASIASESSANSSVSTTTNSSATTTQGHSTTSDDDCVGGAFPMSDIAFQRSPRDATPTPSSRIHIPNLSQHSKHQSESSKMHKRKKQQPSEDSEASDASAGKERSRSGAPIALNKSVPPNYANNSNPAIPNAGKQNLTINIGKTSDAYLFGFKKPKPSRNWEKEFVAETFYERRGILHSTETSPMLSPIDTPNPPQFDHHLNNRNPEGNITSSRPLSGGHKHHDQSHNSHSDSLSFETCVLGGDIGDEGSSSVVSGDDSASLSSFHSLGRSTSNSNLLLNLSGEKDLAMARHDSTSDGDAYSLFSMERQGALGRRKMVALQKHEDMLSDEEQQELIRRKKEKKKKKRAVIADEDAKLTQYNHANTDDSDQSNLSLNVFPKLNDFAHFSATFSPEDYSHFSLDMSLDAHDNGHGGVGNRSKKDSNGKPKREFVLGGGGGGDAGSAKLVSGTNNGNFAGFPTAFQDEAIIEFGARKNMNVTNETPTSIPKPSKLGSSLSAVSRDTSLDLERLLVWDPYANAKRSSDHYFIPEFLATGGLGTNMQQAITGSGGGTKDSLSALSSNMNSSSTGLTSPDMMISKRLSEQNFRREQQKRDTTDLSDTPHAIPHPQMNLIANAISENQSPSRRRRVSLKTENEQMNTRRQTQDRDNDGLSGVGNAGGSNSGLLATIASNVGDYPASPVLNSLLRSNNTNRGVPENLAVLADQDANKSVAKESGAVGDSAVSTALPSASALLQQKRLAVEEMPTIKSELDPNLLYYQLRALMQSSLTSLPPRKLHSATESRTRQIASTFELLDKTLNTEIYKFAILYVAPGQKTEEEILGNKYGSEAYYRFLSRIGDVQKLRGISPNFYTGGLDKSTSLSDGKYGLFWRDELIQIVYHVATHMPTLESDPHCTNKKRHIGNDRVHIVFDESGTQYNPESFVGQFNFIVINITPTDNNTYCIRCSRKTGVGLLGALLMPQIITEEFLPQFVRKVAIYADHTSRKLEKHSQMASNYEERLNLIKSIYNLCEDKGE